MKKVTIITKEGLKTEAVINPNSLMIYTNAGISSSSGYEHVVAMSFNEWQEFQTAVNRKIKNLTKEKK